MESSDASYSRLPSYSSRKRRSSPESNSSLDQHEIRAETMDEDVESQRYYSPQLLRRLESKNRELEARINDMYVEFKTMKSLNQDLKSQVQNLQQQYDRLVSQNIEPESGVNKFKHQSHRTETMTQYIPRQLYNLQQHSREMQPADPVVERLAKDFDERC
ncbi:unnamed protein product [Rotaria sp. Silwood2]|nr:unnamed protein product [Rotaria sp. Silwood2]